MLKQWTFSNSRTNKPQTKYKITLMAGWHHWLNGHESEEAPGVGDGQGGLGCCSPRSHKESDTTELLNWIDLVLYNTDLKKNCPLYSTNYFLFSVPLVDKILNLLYWNNAVTTQVAKNTVISPMYFTYLPLMITFYIIVIHYQTQEIDIETIH